MSLHNEGRVRVLKNGADALYNSTPIDPSQRIYGVPGASLYTADLPAETIKAGLYGEQKVAKILEEVAKDYPNTYILHSVKLPGHLGDMDHIVVRGKLAILVDAKNWQDQSVYQIVPGTDNKDYVYRDGKEFLGGAVSLRTQMGDWKNFLTKYSIKGILAISQEGAVIGKGGSLPFAFVNVHGLKPTLEAILNTRAQAEPLTNKEIKKLASLVQNPNFDAKDENNYEWVLPSTLKGKFSKLAIALSLWTLFNYLIAWFDLAAIPALTVSLIVVGHIHLHTLKKEKYRKGTQLRRRGKGITITALIFTYLLLAFWVPLLIIHAVTAPIIVTP